MTNLTHFSPGTHPLSVDINREVLALAQKFSCQPYLVGGYVRDALIHSKGAGSAADFKPKDLDYAIAGASAFAFAKDIAPILDAHFVPLDQKNDTARLVLRDSITLDFAGCLGASIEVDIRRRDFTINALFWDPSQPEKVIDLVGGIDDINEGIVRGISKQSFTEDPLRLLRAFRFASLLNFKIEPTTEKWIKEERSKIKNVAAERVTFELFATFAMHKSEDVLLSLASCGLLEDILPELLPTKNVPKNSHHHLDLFQHSLETLLEVEKIAEYNQLQFGANLEEELSSGITRFAATKIAALLHDIGKPQTWVVTPEGKHTFIGHEHVGSQMIGDIALRLKWSRPAERLIAKLVKWHLRPGQLFHNSRPTARAVHRLYRQVGVDMPELILLCLADLAATQGPAMLGDKSNNLRADLIELFHGYIVFIKEAEQTPKLLDGGDVMRILELPPSPIVGNILGALEEAQGINEVTNRAQAERFVQTLYKQMRPN